MTFQLNDYHIMSLMGRSLATYWRTYPHVEYVIYIYKWCIALRRWDKALRYLTFLRPTWLLAAGPFHHIQQNLSWSCKEQSEGGWFLQSGTTVQKSYIYIQRVPRVRGLPPPMLPSRAGTELCPSSNSAYYLGVIILLSQPHIIWPGGSPYLPSGAGF